VKGALGYTQKEHARGRPWCHEGKGDLDDLVWKDRQWQWAALRFENGSFDTPNYRDTYALDEWFFQAIAAAPAMFRRDAGAGSL
jgi:hypothetical protein